MPSSQNFVGATTAVIDTNTTGAASKAAMGAIVLASAWLLSGSGAIAQIPAPPSTPQQTTRADKPTSDSYQLLYVDPAAGRDVANGSSEQPLRTITRAIEIATPSTVIVLAPGRYNQASGEVFPIRLKPGVTIQGAPGSRERSAIIEGSGVYESPTRSQQDVAIVAADSAGIAQVAISNPNGYGVWIESASPTILETAFVGSRQTGIYVSGGSPRIQNNYFAGNQVAGLIVFGASNASVASNTFDGTGDAIRIAEGASPEIVGNRIINNNASFVVIGDANPVIRTNQVVGNQHNNVVRVASGNRETLAVKPTARTSQVPTPADAVPGELTNNLPTLAASLPVAPPQTIAAVRPASTPPASTPPASPRVETSPRVEASPRRQSAPLEPIELLPALEEDSSTQETVTQARERQEREEQLANDQGSDTQAIDVRVAETNAESTLSRRGTDEGRIPAGSPGAALDALRSSVALSPRAVSGENPDSPILRRRRGRLRREDSDRNEEIENRREPDVSPLPSPSDSRLSVPGSRIPLGSSGSGRIFSPPSPGVGGPPAPPSRAQALGLYYRVFVEASDPFQQDEVRAVVGDAFRTRFEGRTVMQVGAFPTEEEAEERQRILEDNGFNARIEYIR